MRDAGDSQIRQENQVAGEPYRHHHPAGEIKGQVKWQRTNERNVWRIGRGVVSASESKKRDVREGEEIQERKEASRTSPLEWLGTDNFEGADNLCAQLGGGGSL